MNDSLKSGTTEYIPREMFIVGGDASGSKSTCSGDSGSPIVRFRMNENTNAYVFLVPPFFFREKKGCVSREGGSGFKLENSSY